MSYAQEILEYFLEKDELKSGSSDGEPEYYRYDLQGGFQDTQLVLAMALEGYIVSLVKNQKSYSTYVLRNGDSVKAQLDPFVRTFHTASAAHHRKLSSPANTENKVPSNVRADIHRVLSNNSIQDAGIERPPVFDDELQLHSQATTQHPSLNIGSRDLDPLGKHPEMKPSLTGGVGPDPSVRGGPGLPSQGGMHPTPFGTGNIRYDPPGPGSSFGGPGNGFSLP